MFAFSSIVVVMACVGASLLGGVRADAPADAINATLTT